MSLEKTSSDDVKRQLDEKKDYQLEVDEPLCQHCKRTSSNGIRCLGICVADNEY